MPKVISPEGIETGWRGRLRRRWTVWRKVAPLGPMPPGFFLSIGFDDVPDSAATRGAEVLAQQGCRASWYVATGLLGGDSVSGRILDGARLRELDLAGHEIALHGHRHINMAALPLPDIAADIARNREILAQILGHGPSPHLAYPFGEVTPGLKAQLVADVVSARGIAPRINRAGSDRMQLGAFDLRPEEWRIARAMGAMREAASRGGWVILFAHDVQPDPSPYGITPQVLRDLLQAARGLGAEILPVGEVMARIAGDRPSGMEKGAGSLRRP